MKLESVGSKGLYFGKHHVHYYENGEYLDHGRFIWDRMPEKGDVISPFYKTEWTVVSAEFEPDDGVVRPLIKIEVVK